MSIDLLERMKLELESEYVAYTNFSLSYSTQNKHLLYCFFEGDEDYGYYGMRIEHRTNRKFKFFPCGGKDKVNALMKLIINKTEYKEAITLFFTDKDYSSDVSENNSYVTPCYSIENFYSTKDTLKNILISGFHLHEEERDFTIAMDLFSNLQNKFHNELLLFNSWLSCQNDIRENAKIGTRLNIDKVVKSYFTSIVKDDLENISDFSDLNNITKIENELFTMAPKISKENLDKKVIEFTKDINACIFRGKFEISFFISFLNKLQNEICKKTPNKFNKKHKCNLTFQVHNALSHLTQYANTPECLIKYLEEYKKVS